MTKEALRLFGSQVRLGRKQRRMSETELAERVGMSRTTLRQIEKGDAKVEIGLVFEAAVLVGVDLFIPDVSTLSPQIDRLNDKLALLPQAVRRPSIEIKDDF